MQDIYKRKCNSSIMSVSSIVIFLLFVTQMIMKVQACVNGNAGCESCYNGTCCARCYRGYRLIRESLSCQACSTNIALCSRASYIIDTGTDAVMQGFRINSGVIAACATPNCGVCNIDVNYCEKCKSGFAHTGGGNPSCLACNSSLTNCKECFANNLNLCYQCESEYIVDGNGECMKLFAQNCSVGSTPFTCITCVIGYGVISNLCQPCTDKACRLCDGDVNRCQQCEILFGVALDNTCQLCTDPRCVYCSRNAYNCSRCRYQNYYGWKSTGSCQPCLSPNCLNCHNDFSVCNECLPGYGKDVNGLCILCTSSTSLCLTCDPNDILKCQTCPDQMFLNPTSVTCKPCSLGCLVCLNNTHCIQCQEGYGKETGCVDCGCIQCIISPSNCLECQTGDILTCLSCMTGSYLESNSTCLPCPLHCVECVLNTFYLLPQCKLCAVNTGLDLSSPPVCHPICGDLFLMAPQQCEKELDILYDGCTNACQVEENFTCWENNGSICSFNGTLSIDFTNVNAIPNEINNFVISAKIFPPLFVFSVSPQDQIRKIFQIGNNDKIAVYDVRYDPSTNTLQFFFELKANMMPGETIEIMFLPMFSNMSEYLFSVSQSQFIAIDKTLYYESSSDKQIKQTVELVGYVLVVLGWISFILSIVLKRLPGLEAMFVLQTAFMVFVCLNAYMLTPFQGTSPLKYSTGYNYLFISESSEQQQYQSEMSAPYFNRFGLSRTLLVNNFNLCMVLELVSLVAVLVTHVRLKNQVNEHVNKQMKSCRIKVTDKSNQEVEESVGQQSNNYELTKRMEQNEMSYTLLMNFVLFNLVNFVACSALFFKFGNNTDISSLVVFVLQILILVLTLLKFFFDPVMFGYFRFSFCISEWAMNHYFLHVITLIVTLTTLVVFLSDNTWVSLIAPTMLLVYTLIYRPYKQLTENLRSAFNLLVVDALLFFRVYFSYLCDETQLNSSTTLTYFSILMFFLLPAVVIISIISTVYYYYYYNYKLPKQIQQKKSLIQRQIEESRKKLLNQFVKIDPDKTMENVRMETVFKQIVQNNKNFFKTTNEWNEMKQFNKIIKKQGIERFINCQPLSFANNGINQGRDIAQLKKYKKLLSPQKINKNRLNNNIDQNTSKNGQQKIQFIENKMNQQNNQQQIILQNNSKNSFIKSTNFKQPQENQLLPQTKFQNKQSQQISQIDIPIQFSKQINPKQIAINILKNQQKYINLQAAIKITKKAMQQQIQDQILKEYNNIDVNLIYNENGMGINSKII